MVTIGNNITISAPVQLLTHDITTALLECAWMDIFGEICIGNNCFIGAGSFILSRVFWGDNIVVATGRVVTKSFFKSNIIIVGKLAKIISTWERSLYKNFKYAKSFECLSVKEKRKLLTEKEDVMKNR